MRVDVDVVAGEAPGGGGVWLAGWVGGGGAPSTVPAASPPRSNRPSRPERLGGCRRCSSSPAPLRPRPRPLLYPSLGLSPSASCMCTARTCLRASAHLFFPPPPSPPPPTPSSPRAVENVATKELLQALLGPGEEVPPAWYTKARYRDARRRTHARTQTRRKCAKEVFSGAEPRRCLCGAGLHLQRNREGERRIGRGETAQLEQGQAGDERALGGVKLGGKEGRRGGNGRRRRRPAPS